MAISYQQASRDGQTRNRGRPATRRRVRTRPELFALEPRLLLAGPGVLDSTFGGSGTGVASIDFLPVHATTAVSQSAEAVAIDSTGNIVVAGYVNSPVIKGGEDSATSATVGRLTPSGSPDSSFGQGNGQVIYTSSGAYQGTAGSVDEFSGIVEDDNGNILQNDNDPSLVLVGQHANAALSTEDQGFDFSVASLPVALGSSPSVTTFPFPFDKNAGSEPDDVASAALLQPTVANTPTSNTILVTGSANSPSANAIPIAWSISTAHSTRR